MFKQILFSATVGALSTLLLAACSGGDGGGVGGMPGGQPGFPGPGGVTEVGFVTVQPTNIPLTSDLTGRINAFQTSQVRPQVSGVILERFFTEGSTVRAGERLYRIDPALYQAAVNQARADLARAQASVEAARALAERYVPLAAIEAVSRQDLTNAEAQAKQAEAVVLQAQAQVETAEINLRYTEVKAPIAGRIGRSLYTVGALVTANQIEPLTVIQRLNPIFVDVQQSSADWLELRKAVIGPETRRAKAGMQLILDNDEVYEPVGSVEFSEAAVNESTGTVTWRALFPNEEELLLPGMFVRAQVVQMEATNAFRVPQQGVLRDAEGASYVLIVGPENRVLRRSITTERTIGKDWVVTAGLVTGDRVIVEGTAKVRPDQEVSAVLAGPTPASGEAGDLSGKSASEPTQSP